MGSKGGATTAASALDSNSSYGKAIKSITYKIYCSPTFGGLLLSALLRHGHNEHLGGGGGDDRRVGPLRSHEGGQEQVAGSLAEVLGQFLSHLLLKMCWLLLVPLTDPSVKLYNHREGPY